MATKLADYDKYNYDYSGYWKNRDYENEAEKAVLTKVFKDLSGRRIIDIGGSYGRNVPLYYNKYEEAVIADYSLNTLVKYEKQILDKYPNTKLVAANAYKLPFAEDSFDAAIMIRVLHHLSDVDQYYSELSKIISGEGIYVQEFANKVHLKAIIRSVLKLDFATFNKEPYQQPSKGNFEGSTEESPFMNFHPKYIKQHLKANGFNVEQTKTCSYLRIPFIKKRLSIRTMLKIERFLQKTLNWAKLTPSVIYISVSKKLPTSQRARNKRFEEILVCPVCKGSLTIKNGAATCNECGKVYKKHSSVWDFRVN